MEVLQLIAEGSANKETAAEPGVCIKTVGKHREHLMEKLDIHDTAGFTRYAISAGIIESSFQLTIVQMTFTPYSFAFRSVSNESLVRRGKQVVLTIELHRLRTIVADNGLMTSSFTEQFRNDENKNSAAKASSAK
jgi:DNA-binding CsgD family transcriptional regulator